MGQRSQNELIKSVLEQNPCEKIPLERPRIIWEDIIIKKTCVINWWLELERKSNRSRRMENWAKNTRIGQKTLRGGGRIVFVFLILIYR